MLLTGTTMEKSLTHHFRSNLNASLGDFSGQGTDKNSLIRTCFFFCLWAFNFLGPRGPLVEPSIFPSRPVHPSRPVRNNFS